MEEAAGLEPDTLSGYFGVRAQRALHCASTTSEQVNHLYSIISILVEKSNTFNLYLKKYFDKKTLRIPCIQEKNTRFLLTRYGPPTMLDASPLIT